MWILIISVPVLPPSDSFLLVREEQGDLYSGRLRLEGGGEAEGFCTGRGCLRSAVAKLLAQRYTAESPGSVGSIFREEKDPVGILAENRVLGIPESSTGC